MKVKQIIPNQCYAYLRVSDSTQVAGDGFPRQLKACTDYATAHGMTIATVYREDISGTEYDRPVLAELFLALEQNGHGIHTVLIERLDRLARDLMIQETIVRDFQSKGFALISAEEGADLVDDSPTRKFIRQVLGAAAEFDKSMLVAKLKASRDRMRNRTGKCEGRKGYRDTPDGQALIRQLQLLRRRNRYGKQRTLQQVADELNRKGISTLDGATWSLHRVRKVLLKG
jgi:DNA invertase Pin-like site-specific DNA recombinase